MIRHTIRQLAVVLAISIGVAAHAMAQNDVGHGNGQHGAFTAPAGVSSINIYTALSANASPGAVAIVVDSPAGFSGGDAIMIWRPAGLPKTVINAQGSVELTGWDTGRYELARIDQVSDAVFTLASPLAHGFAATLTQVIRVPEFTTVVVPTGAVLRPGHAWNGSTGGIVAFLATGVVTVNGEITATGFGFRGGNGVSDDVPREAGQEEVDCTGFEPSPLTGHHGEGVANSLADGLSQQMPVSNGGKGGGCFGGGGGGGGHGGRGGLGKLFPNGISGLPGAPGGPVVYSMAERLVFGGGGGAGHIWETSNPGVADGRVGGGVVFMRGASLAGAGAITADGTASFNLTHGGAGGGGGVYVGLLGPTSICGNLKARGGRGGVGHPTATFGGGGGGGHIFLQTSTPCTAADVAGGIGNADTVFAHGVAGVVEKVMLQNPAPTVTAGPDRDLFTCAGCLHPATLAGAASDPEGEPLMVEWRKGSQVLATTLTPTLYFGEGSHTLVLAVRDSVQTVTDEMTITVTGGGDVASLLQQLNQAAATIADRESTIAARDETIAAHATEVSNLDAEITRLKEENATLAGERDAAAEALAARDATIAALQEDLDEANAAIAAHLATIRDQDELMAGHAAELAGRDGTIAGLRGDLETAGGIIAARDAQIAGLIADLQAANQAVSRLTSELQAANVAVVVLRQQVAELQQQLQAAIGDPTFTIPGATVPEQIENLVTAIEGLNPGQKQALYKNLGGKKK